MVKKLFKQEFISYLRTLIPIQIILLGIALINRIIQLFEADTVTYSIVFTSSVIALIIAATVCFVMTFIVTVKRYYSNLFTNEGYLTFTLPVKTSQIILTKLITAGVMVIISLIAIFLSVSIATFGDVLVEIFKAIIFLTSRFYNRFAVNGIFYIIEFVLDILSFLLTSLLLFYACITIGQTAKKNRVLSAFGIYFAYYLIRQIIYTVLIILGTVYRKYLPVDTILNFVEENNRLAVHIILLLILVFNILFGILYYLISKFIIKNKLNLE